MKLFHTSKPRAGQMWTAKDVMQTEVVTVEPSMRLQDLEQLLTDRHISGCPVVDDGDFVGVVSHSDILRLLCDERRVAKRSSDFYRDDTGFHAVPLVSFADIADRIGERIESLRVKDVMTEKTWAVSPDQPLVEVAQKLTEHRIHRLPVTDQGTLVGIISTLDLVQLFADRRV